MVTFAVSHLDNVATFPGTKYMYSMIFRLDIVVNRISGQKGVAQGGHNIPSALYT